MANMHPLSAMLQQFDANVTPNLSAMSSAASNIAAEIGGASNSYQSALGGLTSAIQDPQGQSMVASVQLVSSACDVLKKSIEGDIAMIISECGEVAKIIEEIKQKIQEGSALQPSGWDKVWNAITKIFSTKWCQNDQAKIDRLNAEIDHLNQAGEAQIGAIQGASGGVSLGIIGNMVAGGSLGPYIDFDSLYDFDYEKYKAQNPVDYGETIVGGAATAVVGAVESVFKVGEGIVDFGLTAASAVTSFFGLWDNKVSQALANAAKHDTVGAVADMAYDKLDDWGMYSKTGKTIGNITGSVFAHGVLWMVPGGAILSSVAIAGNTAEDALQNGSGSTGALLKGTAMGALSYAGGKVLPAVTSKVGSWIGGTRLGQATINAANKFAQTGVGKVVTAPVRWMGNAMQKTANGINNYIGNHSGNVVGKTMGALAKADTAIETGAQKIAGQVTNKLGLSGAADDAAAAAAGTADDAAKAATTTASTADDAAKAATTTASTADDAAKAATTTASTADDAAKAAASTNSGTDVQARVNDVTGVSRTPASANGAPTATDSALASASDDTFAAYQARNKVGTQSMIDDVTGVSRTPASANGAPTATDSAFASASDDTFAAYQRQNGYGSTSNYSINQQGTPAYQTTNSSAANWEAAQLKYEANPSSSNFKTAQNALDDLTLAQNADDAFYQASNHTVGNIQSDPYALPSASGNTPAITAQNSMFANNGAPTSAADSAFASASDDVFTAYQARNKVGTQSMIDDVTGVSRTPASANGAPTATDSAFASASDDTFAAYQARNKVGTQSMIDDVTGVSRTPASANGAPTAADSAFASASDDALAAYQTRNGLNNTLPTAGDSAFASASDDALAAYQARNGLNNTLPTAGDSAFASASDDALAAYQARNGLNNTLPTAGDSALESVSDDVFAAYQRRHGISPDTGDDILIHTMDDFMPVTKYAPPTPPEVYAVTPPAPPTPPTPPTPSTTTTTTTTTPQTNGTGFYAGLYAGMTEASDKPRFSNDSTGTVPA